MPAPPATRDGQGSQCSAALVTSFMEQFLEDSVERKQVKRLLRLGVAVELFDCLVVPVVESYDA
jgi:hypothetical protein